MFKKIFIRIFKPHLICNQKGHRPVDYVCEVLTRDGAGGPCVGQEEIWIETKCSRCGQWLDIKQKHFLRGLCVMSYNSEEMCRYGRFIKNCFKKGR